MARTAITQKKEHMNLNKNSSSIPVDLQETRKKPENREEGD